LAVFVSMITLSTTAILIRFLTERDMPPLVIAFWRDLLVAVVLAVVLAIIRPALLKVPRRHWRFLVMYGLILMVFNATWTVSVALNGAAVSTVLAYSSPTLTALIAWALWRESLGWYKIAAVLLSLAGCVLVSGAYSLELWQGNPVGIFFGLVSGLMYAIYSIAGKETTRRQINSWTVLLVIFGLAAVFFVIPLLMGIGRWSPQLANVGDMSDIMWLGADWRGWLILIVLAWGPTLGGYGMFIYSMNYLPASVASLIMSIEPGMTALLAFILLGEELAPLQIIGTVLIVGGVMLLRVESLWRRRQLARVSPTL
jgi:drug/metabolite transporter (DMT)-like permease